MAVEIVMTMDRETTFIEGRYAKGKVCLDESEILSTTDDGCYCQDGCKPRTVYSEGELVIFKANLNP